jgi:hypothetical protein
MSETIEQMVAEMHRSGDSRYLIEWIEGVARDFPTDAVSQLILPAIAAYYEANES